MSNSKYTICDIAGGGQIFFKDTDNGDKFKIIEMSAEEIKIKTNLLLELDTIVDFKIHLDSVLFQIKIDAVGRVVEKLDSTLKYRVEFMDLSNRVKEEIDGIMRSTCNLD